MKLSFAPDPNKFRKLYLVVNTNINQPIYFHNIKGCYQIRKIRKCQSFRENQEIKVFGENQGKKSNIELFQGKLGNFHGHLSLYYLCCNYLIFLLNPWFCIVRFVTWNTCSLSPNMWCVVRFGISPFSHLYDRSNEYKCMLTVFLTFCSFYPFVWVSMAF